MHIILNAWPIILTFWGSKVSIKGIASTNPQQYCDKKYWLSCQYSIHVRQYYILIYVHVTACNPHISMTYRMLITFSSNALLKVVTWQLKCQHYFLMLNMHTYYSQNDASIILNYLPLLPWPAYASSLQLTSSHVSRRKVIIITVTVAIILQWLVVAQYSTAQLVQLYQLISILPSTTGRIEGSW